MRLEFAFANWGFGRIEGDKKGDFQKGHREGGKEEVLRECVFPPISKIVFPIRQGILKTHR